MMDILKRAGMVDCKTVTTPVSLIQDSGDPAVPYGDPTQYRSLAGVLQYLTVTRPNLSFAVNKLCHHMLTPTTIHWGMLSVFCGILKVCYTLVFISLNLCLLIYMPFWIRTGGVV